MYAGFLSLSLPELELPGPKATEAGSEAGLLEPTHEEQHGGQATAHWGWIPLYPTSPSPLALPFYMSSTPSGTPSSGLFIYGHH